LEPEASQTSSPGLDFAMGYVGPALSRSVWFESKAMSTTASVHAGTLGRHFEVLCRIRVHRIAEITRNHGRALRAGSLPNAGGVYCFWWTGDLRLLATTGCIRTITLSGPGGRPVAVCFDDEWLGLSADAPVPLYVGKNADSIAKRVGQHLTLQRDRAVPTFTGNRKQPRPTTSCQLRAGVDQLFPGHGCTRDLVLDNVGLSYVELDGDEHAVNRFYLEDLAIGMMRPPLNIDVER